jgi:hypothetical protein
MSGLQQKYWAFHEITVGATCTRCATYKEQVEILTYYTVQQFWRDRRHLMMATYGWSMLWGRRVTSDKLHWRWKYIIWNKWYINATGCLNMILHKLTAQHHILADCTLQNQKCLWSSMPVWFVSTCRKLKWKITLRFSGLWCHVVWQMGTNISVEHTASFYHQVHALLKANTN